MKRTQPFLVAISGVTGSGKTTLARNLKAKLPDAVDFRFEPYQAARNEAQGAGFVLHDHEAWDRVGYDPNRALGEPPGLDDLRRLLAGETVHPPGVKAPVTPASVVLLEDGFARDLHALDGLIDLSIHISIPLDVALCRALLRFERNGKDPTFWVHNYMDYSLHFFYARLEQVKESADLVLDGMKDAEQVCEEALKAVQRHTG